MQLDQLDIAGAVILYNPDDTIYGNISTYLDQVKTLYVIDNSTNYNLPLINRLKTNRNMVYLDNHANKGIGHALNRGANEALKSGFRWLLTMDQDTVLFPGYISALLRGVKAVGIEKTGIIAPWYDAARRKPAALEEIPFTMTSANLLNLNVYQRAGEFKEDLFMDHVDHEYGLRLNALGFKVVQVNSVNLKHIPGAAAGFRFLGLRISFVIHSATRNYYFTRNGFWVSKMYQDKYPSFRSFFYKLLFRNVIKAILHREDRKRRIALIWKGYIDYRNKITGAFHEAGN